MLDADRPLAWPARHDLTAVNEVRIGRGDTPAARRSPARHELVLTIADARVSVEHARLWRERRGWVVEDTGSRNGTRVRGQRIARAALVDGDVIEVGRTFFLYREAAAPVHEDASDIDAGVLDVPVPELLTLNGQLASETDRLVKVAATSVPILIAGDTGTGKEVVARAAHQLSGRAGALVAVNCGALVATLVESELFGVRRGAYSGAGEDRSGLVRAAHGGTLFLDEIGDLPLPMQAAFLRVLQEQTVTPVGGSKATSVDFRLVCATHVDLDALVDAGSFRRDLRARLGGVTITLPPLRARREDLGLLVGRIIRRHDAGAGLRFTPPAARALLHYDWPDNVRELERSLLAAIALAAGERVGTEHLPAPVAAILEADARGPEPRAPGPADEELRAQLTSLLTEHRGNVAAVARALGRQRVQVHRWLRRLAIDPTPFRM